MNSLIRVFASLETRALNTPSITSWLITPSAEMNDGTSNLISLSSVSFFTTEVWHISINFVGYFASFVSVPNSQAFLSTSFRKGRGLIREKIRFPSSKFLRLAEIEDLSFITRVFNSSNSFSIIRHRSVDTFPRLFFCWRVSFLSLIIWWRAELQYRNKVSCGSTAKHEFLCSEVEFDFLSGTWLWIVQ